MNTKMKKCCPGCSQFYQLKYSESTANGNVPLFLHCGHSMCENCIKNIVKFDEPFNCRICKQDIQIDPHELNLYQQKKTSLYSIFPINIYMVGELTMQLFQSKNETKHRNEDECFVDIKEIIKSTESTHGTCVECHGSTSKMCEQCSIIVCNNCFNKSHKNFVIFQNHALKNIEGHLKKSICKLHQDKPLDYYCKDCSKSMCMDCLIVGGDTCKCKNHDTISVQEMNEKCLADLGNISPKVDEICRRLTKTALDVGHILSNKNDDTGTTHYTNLINKIDQHFSKLSSVIQKQKEGIIQEVLKRKALEIESLKQAKHNITQNIMKAMKTANIIKSLDPNKLKEINLSIILDDAKEIVNSPWYLNQDQSESTLDVTINEEVFSTVSNYMKLEGDLNFGYNLYTTDELTENNIAVPPAPSSIMYPPEIIKDVRQTNKPKNKTKEVQENIKPMNFLEKIPKYRSKSGSCSSLNSITSDSSLKTYLSYESKPPMLQPNNQYNYDNEQPIPLVEGAQELIYVSHIVSPHELYVQRASEQPRVERLMRDLRHAASLPRPTHAHVLEGKIYIVFNKVDKFWQRCCITSIDRKDTNKPIFHVFCIDFGSTLAVTIEKLRLIPPALAQSPPPFVICCALHNCEPVTGTWSSDDSLLIQNIIDNKQAILHVRGARAGVGAVGARLLCDVTTFEEGVSVAHALAFHGRARLPRALPCPKMSGIMETPKIFMGNYDCKKNTIEQVYITHIISPDNFFVREEHLQDAYQKICEDLEQEYNLAVKTGSIYLPEKNMACVANVEKCGLEVSWARAIVLELPGRSRVRLLLPDIGAQVLVHWTAIRRILKKFTVQRALAKECHLAGVTPLNKKWSSNSVVLLESFQGKVLELVVEDNRNRNSLGVTLYDKSDEENVICINNLMIKNKFAVTFGLYMFNKYVETDELVHNNGPPTNEQKPKVKPKEKLQILKKQPPQIQKSKQDQLEAKDKGPLRLEVKVLTYQSPSLLYVSIVHQQKIFNELFEKIQNYYTKKKTQARTDWKVGDRCCTICYQSQTWRRAAILEIENDNAKVFYSDFACAETVSLSSLRDIPQELASLGDAAIMCHLCGVVPAVGEEWPSLTKEYLKDLLDAYKRIFITKLGKFKGKSMPIELWVYHTVQGGALEPNKSEWRCLNKKIIEQGLGIPDKSQLEYDKEKNTENTGDDMLSFLNITGTVRDWVQIEPIPLKPLKIISDSDSNSTLNDVDTMKSEDTQVSNTLFITDWLQPEPLSSNEFTGMPTYIDNEGVIYLHDISQQDTLELIRKALDVRFQKQDPKAKFCKWTVGEPCIALFFLDNRFYRGRVVEVNEEASTCLIQYVDYGNEEICAFENIRKSIVLHQIPVQAHKCILHRIRPVDAHWDRQTLDYIHKSIVEKNCLVKVAGEPIGDLIPIELKYDKLWINDHLVDFEMAVYTDGSKAIVRKFVPSVIDTQMLEQSLESDSGPDYIIEDEDNPNQTIKSESSSNTKEYALKDWVKIMDEEDVEQQAIEGNFMTYTPFTETKFMCNITVLNEIDKLELAVIHDEETSKAYDNMFEELQEACHDMSPLNGIYENKACLALFPEDDQWYRAIILQYSEATSRIKVKYVDYGNIEIVSLAHVREISERFARLPPATVTVTLHGVKPNPDVDKAKLVQHYTDTFIEKGSFHVQVIDDSDIILSVDLRDDEGNLIYEHLIQENLLISN